MPKFGIVIHGGAGAIARKRMTSEVEHDIRRCLREALDAGHAVLAAGGASLDAVEAAVVVMEDSPLFNAGKGAVFTHDGLHEQDATIMDGATRDCGAVAGIRHVRSPVRAARAVMLHSPYVLLAGEGAERFARIQGLPTADASYFFTQQRWAQLGRARDRERDTGRRATELSEGGQGTDTRHGTVGAVALDQGGNLAAATSSGGMTNKRWGRVGDSAQVGAGTYADNATCAVSATGHGEYFMRGLTAYDLSALMEYAELSLAEAAGKVIHDKLVALGGTGGLVAIDARGNIAMPYVSGGMYRGHHVEGANPAVMIFET